jgi:DNA uptake protein ComE-like DNA-binding protein
MFVNFAGFMRSRSSPLVMLAVFLLGPLASELHAQNRNRTYNEALFAGAGALRARQYESAREPLEYALQKAADDQSRLKAHALLTEVYFHAGQTDKVINSLDFILTHSDSEPQRALVRGAMVNSVRGEGRSEEVIRLYEGRLRADNEDIAALYVLSDIYSKVQRNPKRASELVTRLGKILQKNVENHETFADPNLAGQYVSAGKFKEGAAMYEQLALNDPNLAGVYYKDAGQAWLKAGNKAKALAAAKSADSSAPENRNELLEYFYHRGLGEIYFATNEPALAAEHFEEAIAKTKIDGYAKDTHKLLDQARTIISRRSRGTGATASNRSTASGTAIKSSKSTSATASAAIDLNKASLSKLLSVDGITETIAIQIIDHRKSKPFESVSELIELDGVDRATLDKIRSKVTVGPSK